MPERKRFLLRIDPELYAALERWAAAELRSVNAQIEYLLTEAARKAGRLKPGPAVDEAARGDVVEPRPDGASEDQAEG